MKKVGILMGSASDLPVVEKAINVLKEYGVPFEVHVYSAHRTPVESAEFAKNAKANGFGAIICAAGMAAHLAGAIAANTTLPVIGIPVSGGVLDGITSGRDSLQALGKTGRLIDLDSEACASIKEKYGDRFIYAVPNDESYGGREAAVCIDISDSRLVTEYKVYNEPCALGIGANSSNIEAVERFLDFIFEEFVIFYYVY